MNISFIENNINYLIECAKDENEGIKEGSLKSFWSFIEWGNAHGNFLNDPIVSLTPNNELYATWQQEKKHCFLFHDDGNIKYFVI